MRVEMLTIPGCPHELRAMALLNRAMDQEGIRSAIQHMVICDTTTAERMQFHSSPTIRINGHDVWLEGAPAGGEGVSCWIFPGREDERRLVEVIRQALRRQLGPEDA